MNQLALAALVVTSIGSCDPASFKNPLTDPAKAKVDGKLTGTWGARDESTEFVLFVQPTQQGKVDVTLVGRGTNDGVSHMTWRGMTSTVGGKTYLNLQEKFFTDNWGNKYEVKPDYIVVRYELTGDTLKLNYLDGDGLNALDGGAAALTAETAGVAATIEKLPAKSFTHFMNFKRFKVPAP
jgi:acyl-coenzyme A thioesterase PaaI-like protein